jgi:hypothetical protein
MSGAIPLLPPVCLNDVHTHNFTFYHYKSAVERYSFCITIPNTESEMTIDTISSFNIETVFQMTVTDVNEICLLYLIVNFYSLSCL